jgi:hypothetical protein
MEILRPTHPPTTVTINAARPAIDSRPYPLRQSQIRTKRMIRNATAVVRNHARDGAEAVAARR